jgi:hypothetical protein
VLHLAAERHVDRSIIDRAQLERLGRAFEKSDYGRYLLNLED